MKVLHLVSRYRWTGCAEPAVNLCRFLVEAGVDSRLCCVPGGSLQREALRLGTRLEEATHLGRDYTPWGILRAARRLARFVRDEGIDLLHAHTQHDHWLAALAMRIAPAGASVPIVRTHHETRRIRSGFVWRRILNDTTAANITVSGASREFFVNRRAIRPDLVRTIQGGLDFSRFATPSPSAEVRAAWGIPREAPIVAHLSHIGPDRRQEVMLEAFSLLSAEFPDARLLFLGQGNKSTVRWIRRRIDATPFADRVVLSRDFADRGLPWAAQVGAVDLVVVLAVGSEGSSRGVMEAMALARPVIGARVGVLPELIDEGRTGWIVDADRPMHLAGAIRRVLSEPPLGRRVGSAASVTVRTRFRCERQAKEVLDLYREVLGLASRSHPAAGSR